MIKTIKVEGPLHVVCRCDKCKAQPVQEPVAEFDMTDSGWRKRQIALDVKAENARELGLDYEPDKTIEMARKAGAVFPADGSYHSFERHEDLEAFAALVRADERNRTWTQEHWTEYERSIAAAEREAMAEEWETVHGFDKYGVAAFIRVRGEQA